MLRLRSFFPSWLRKLGYISLSVVLGVVFIYAGALKLHDPWRFADAIYAFRLLPRELIIPLALTLPIVEIFAGLLLMSGRPRRLGAFAVLLMTIVFAAAIASALARGLIINCNCFGEAGVPTRLKLWAALGRDALLFISALILYLTTAATGSKAKSQPR